MANRPLSPPDPEDPGGKRRVSRAGIGDWGSYAGFGIQFAVIIGVFALAGWKLDDWLGTEPLLLLLLLLLGFVGATVSLVKQLPTSKRPSKKP